MTGVRAFANGDLLAPLILRPPCSRRDIPRIFVSDPSGRISLEGNTPRKSLRTSVTSECLLRVGVYVLQIGAIKQLRRVVFFSDPSRIVTTWR